MALTTTTIVGAWTGLGLLLWFISLFVPSPPSKFLLTPEKLRESMIEYGEPLSSALVAHRGFHYANDDMKRPLENTIAAYEKAWSSNVVYAECDVTTTKDGEVVLAHDANLKRLALHPASSVALKPIRQLDYNKDLLNFPLKDGSKVPKLVEVLQAARRVNINSKLVIEIKEDNLECARKVALLAATDLGEFIAIVMGFSVNAVAEFAKINPRKRHIQVLLLTVKQDAGDGSVVLNLSKLDSVESIVKEKKLDGVYAEFDQSFLTDQRFAQFCKRRIVGVWGLSRDSVSTAVQLIGKGATFVNSDLPDEFFHV